MSFKKEWKKVKQKTKEVIDNPSLIEDGILKLSKHIANAGKNLQKHVEDFIEKFEDKAQHEQTIFMPEDKQNVEISGQNTIEEL